MTRARILPFSLAISWDSFGEKLINTKYTDIEARGVIVNDFSNFEINATYFEKIVYEETINDPVNGSINVTRETFFTTNFIAFSNKTLCIINPSRRLSNFLLFIMSKMDYKFSLQEEKLNISSFCKAAPLIFSDFKITKTSYRQFNLTETLKCTMALSSPEDIFGQIESLNMNIPCTPSKITFGGNFLGKAFKADISDQGAISVASANHAAFFQTIAEMRATIFRPE